jgi:hypothetical protein
MNAQKKKRATEKKEAALEKRKQDLANSNAKLFAKHKAETADDKIEALTIELLKLTERQNKTQGNVKGLLKEKPQESKKANPSKQKQVKQTTANVQQKGKKNDPKKSRTDKGKSKQRKKGDNSGRDTGK